MYQNLSKEVCEIRNHIGMRNSRYAKFKTNSEDVAKAHYLQVTDEHFERATCLIDAPEGGAPGGARTALHGGAASTQCDTKPLVSLHGGAPPCRVMTPTGLEPVLPA